MGKARPQRLFSPGRDADQAGGRWIINGRLTSRPVSPTRQCLCGNHAKGNDCAGRKGIWPVTHVDGRGICFECRLEMTARPDQPDPVPVYEEDSPSALDEMRRLGIVLEQSIRQVDGCEGPCNGGMKPLAKRYCLACESVMRRGMAEAGWDELRILAWCMKQDCAEWTAEELARWMSKQQKRPSRKRREPALASMTA